MGPGPQRKQTIDHFWTKVYSGYHVGDMDALQARSFALNGYLCTLDKLHEVNAAPEDQTIDSGLTLHPSHILHALKNTDTRASQYDSPVSLFTTYLYKSFCHPLTNSYRHIRRFCEVHPHEEFRQETKRSIRSRPG
jgi:hypothetical protein